MRKRKGAGKVIYINYDPNSALDFDYYTIIESNSPDCGIGAEPQCTRRDTEHRFSTKAASQAVTLGRESKSIYTVRRRISAVACNPRISLSCPRHVRLYLGGHHLPLKTGFLFSANAFRASSLSSVLTTLSYIAFSISSCGLCTACNAALVATGPPSLISVASLTASLSTSRLADERIWSAVALSPFFSFSMSSSLSGTTSTSRSAMPRKSLARPIPISEGRRCVPPAPGMMPSLVSGSPITALEDRTRKCVDRASSSPPPRARELIAEMVGMGRAEMLVNVERRRARKAAVLEDWEFQSANSSYTRAHGRWSSPSLVRLRPDWDPDGKPRGNTYSSGVKPLLSLRSAPAQKELSTALARIRALVGPLSSWPAAPPNLLFQLFAASSSPVDASYCEWTSSISPRRDARRALDMAFRADGRFSSRTRMWPVLGAGRLVTRIRGASFAVE
ncbi:hypothetical protein FJTKL_07295 [Diaporthe vaccinii]|uniref:Uncharacterized protein n=1 Tax=Diaporthe vaccinii TaxID=105482 RepID=A0ABR4EUD4_9PEZI